MPRRQMDRPVPDRIELRAVAPGESELMLNHCHQPAHSPTRATHAIFVREGAMQRFDALDTIPGVFKTRTLSLCGFDADGMMVATDLVDGRVAAPAIEAVFADSAVATLDAHYAAPGCFAAHIETMCGRRTA